MRTSGRSGFRRGLRMGSSCFRRNRIFFTRRRLMLQPHDRAIRFDDPAIGVVMELRNWGVWQRALVRKDLKAGLLALLSEICSTNVRAVRRSRRGIIRRQRRGGFGAGFADSLDFGSRYAEVVAEADGRVNQHAAEVTGGIFVDQIYRHFADAQAPERQPRTQNCMKASVAGDGQVHAAAWRGTRWALNPQKESVIAPRPMRRRSAAFRCSVGLSQFGDELVDIAAVGGWHSLGVGLEVARAEDDIGIVFQAFADEERGCGRVRCCSSQSIVIEASRRRNLLPVRCWVAFLRAVCRKCERRQSVIGHSHGFPGV